MKFSQFCIDVGAIIEEKVKKHLTWQWKMDHWRMHFLLKVFYIFHCHVCNILFFFRHGSGKRMKAPWETELISQGPIFHLRDYGRKSIFVNIQLCLQDVVVNESLSSEVFLTGWISLRPTGWLLSCDMSLLISRSATKKTLVLSVILVGL